MDKFVRSFSHIENRIASERPAALVEHFIYIVT
jgi:hypothetical protein